MLANLSDICRLNLTSMPRWRERLGLRVCSDMEVGVRIGVVSAVWCNIGLGMK